MVGTRLETKGEKAHSKRSLPYSVFVAVVVLRLAALWSDLWGAALAAARETDIRSAALAHQMHHANARGVFAGQSPWSARSLRYSG